MKRIIILAIFGYALSFLPNANAALASSPKGQVYLVHVFSSFDTEFYDCYSFEKSGTLSIKDYGPINYRFDELNTETEDWQATAGTNPPFGFVLSFHGHVGGSTGKTIVGNGLSSNGDTFILQGVVNPGCASSAKQPSGTTPYRR